MKLHYQDYFANPETWSGLLLSVDNPNKPLLRLHTAHPGLMKLSASDQALLWGQIDPYFCGVAVLRALPKSAEIALLPRIRSANIEQAAQLTGEPWMRYWARFFVHALQDSPATALYSGLWALEFCRLGGYYHGDPRWLGKAKWAKETDEDKSFLSAHKLYIDWGVSGNGSVISLFPRHELPEQSGRIKWWLKVSMSGPLPPILIWYIGALSAYVVLDGHDRLQTALITGIAPTFFVLTSYMERAVELDKTLQNAIIHQLEIMQQKIDEGTYINPSAFAGVQRALVQSFDNRPRKIDMTQGYADMSHEQWHLETREFESARRSDASDIDWTEFYIKI